MPSSRRLCPGINGMRCPTNAVISGRARRCEDCTPAHEQARGSRQERGYDRPHERLKARWQRRIDRGEDVRCWRCQTTPILPGMVWDLGHDDHDRTKYRGPECIPCSRANAGRKSRSVTARGGG